MTVIHDLRVECILIRDRLRPLNEKAVTDLVESMRRVGQLQPITVQHRSGMPYLVAGHHRLMAAKALEFEMIACVMLPTEATADDCLQIEISENLHRNDLTKEERDRHLRLLAEIHQRQSQIQVQQNATPEIGYGKPPPQTKGVVAKVAEQTGLSKDTVRRALNPEKEQAKREAAKISDAAARAEEKSARRAQQVENERQREEARAGLPDFVREREERRSAASTASDDTAPEPTYDGLSAEARIAELEEAVRSLEAENVRLKAENVKFEGMRVQWEKGGVDEILAGKDEQIRVMGEQLYKESADKASWAKTAKFFIQEAKDRGYSKDVVIDMKTGAIRNG